MTNEEKLREVFPKTIFIQKKEEDKTAALMVSDEWLEADILTRAMRKRRIEEMEEQLYTVLDGNTILASNMTIDNAMILVKGYFDKYYEEPRMTLTIERVPRSINYGNQEAADEG